VGRDPRRRVLLSLRFGGLGLFGIVGVVAAIVYLVDVRPAVRRPAARRAVG
jgi:hypothetical protein